MKKVAMSIQLNVLQVHASPYIKENFYILWQRGPQTDATKIVKMSKGTTTVDINERFNRVSTFYQNKKNGTY